MLNDNVHDIHAEKLRQAKELRDKRVLLAIKDHDVIPAREEHSNGIDNIQCVSIDTVPIIKAITE